jgi:probable HAF family extracellular repeat protein
MKPFGNYKSRMLTNIFAFTVFAALAMPVCGVAQNIATQEPKATHHHYKLVVIEPLGGPASSASGPDEVILNNRGTFAAYANTATPNPNANCFIPFNAGDCFVEHPVLWHKGTLTDLELLPGGANGQTVSIGENGLIAGFSENGMTDPFSGLPVGRAVVWTKDGKVIDLGTVPGGTGSLATAVNNLGQVVGFSDNGISDPFSMVGGFATQTRAFLRQNGVMKDLGTLGGSDSLASNLNELGQIAGISYTDSNASPSCFWALTTHPFFWENGKMTDVGSLGGTCGAVNWMNNLGQVVGFSNVAGDQSNHAFLWDKEHGLKDLGTLPGGSFSGANWINDAGEIAGASDVSNGGHAVLWKNGAIIDLGLLPGDCNSEALAINSQGQIVGNSSPDCIVDGNVVLWEKGSAAVNINTLVTPASDVTAVYALEINDRGEIAAHGFTSTGDQRGVLLLPCDENHPDLEGCDYDLVDAATEVQSNAAPHVSGPKAAVQASLTPSQMKDRMRTLLTRRTRRFGAVPPK